MGGFLSHVSILVATVFVLAACTGTRLAGDNSPPPPVRLDLSEFLTSRGPLTICWLGNDAWLLRTPDLLVGFDLDLMPSPQRLHAPAITAEELAPALDVVFITHSHGDHFNDVTAIALAKKSRCVFVLPANCVAQGRKLGIPDDRIITAHPKKAFDLKGLHVEPIHAIHGHRFQTVHKGANLEDCGYIVEIAGVRVLQPGDSVLTQDHLALKNIDVLFVSPTDHNMAVEPAARFITVLRPRWVFPQHYGTYRPTPETDFWTIGQPSALRAALPADLQQNFHQLRQAQIFPLAVR